MKSLLAVALLTISTAAHADIFDTTTTDGLGKAWAKAIQDNSTDELKPLLHPDCAKFNTPSAVLTRMVSGGLPPAYTFSTMEVPGTPEQLDKTFGVRPTQQLVINYMAANDDDKRRYGIGKGFPIAQKDGHWYFTVCKKQ